jgi:hypothetical protein
VATLWTRILAALRGPVEVEEPVPVDLRAPPQATANPDLDVERPDEAFEVLRRVAKASDARQSFVVLKKGRVPPHQRHLVPVKLERAAPSDETEAPDET